MRPWTRQPRGGRLQRGAALLVVMVAVALVTAVAVELAYQTRVSLRIAGNARDELRAQALARGSVALGRLVLHFQARLDEASGRGAAQLSALGGGASGAAGAAASALAKQAAASVPRPQIWKLVPVDSALVANLFGGGGWAADRPAEGRPEGSAPAPGGPDGTFQAVIDDEDRKVNVQFDALDAGGLQGARLESFLALVGDRRWDFLFEREDAGGQRTSRTDLAVHLKDWTDADTAQSAVTGLPDKPFEPGFGDENFAYDRGPDRYKAKNARFDSLDELFLVTGVSDAFMSAFGDRLTVYLGQNSKMNVNADDPEELLRNARIMAGIAAQHPALSDPTFAARLQKGVRELSQGGFLAITPYQFAQLLEQLGLAVNPSYLQAANTDQRGGFTDRSRVFRVRGVATVGAVEKSIEAVVTFDPIQAREQATQLGRLLHWREE